MLYYVDYKSKKEWMDVQGEWRYGDAPCKLVAFSTAEDAENYIKNHIPWPSEIALWEKPVIKTIDKKYSDLKCKTCSATLHGHQCLGRE